MDLIIDPGLKGAAVLFDDVRPVSSFCFSVGFSGIDIYKFNDFIEGIYKSYPECRVYIEKIDPFPGQNIKTSTRQFFVLGQTYAIVERYFNTVYKVPPQSWTPYLKKFCLRNFQFIGKSKEVAQVVSRQCFPEFAHLHIPKRGFKVHDGVADCLSISIWLNKLYWTDWTIDDIGFIY